MRTLTATAAAAILLLTGCGKNSDTGTGPGPDTLSIQGMWALQIEAELFIEGTDTNMFTKTTPVEDVNFILVIDEDSLTVHRYLQGHTVKSEGSDYFFDGTRLILGDDSNTVHLEQGKITIEWTESDGATQYISRLVFVAYTGPLPPEHWPDPPPVPAAAKPVVLGTPYDSAFNQGSTPVTHWYSFSATGGTAYTIAFELEDTDLTYAIAVLYAVDGNSLVPLAYDDIPIGFLCPATGTYYVAVAGIDTGYRLTVLED
jgi:hypothetical protein